MNPSLTDFHRILFLDLMPWQTRDWPAAKFKELNHNLIPNLPQIQPFFKVEFGKALSPKRIYFNSIIDSASNKYLNEIFQIHGTIKDAREYKYWAHLELTKTLAAKLNETEETISKMNLHLEKLSPSLKSQSDDPNHQDEIFIIQTLKHYLIRLYMEVQELFKDHLPDPFKTEEEIHQIFFSEHQIPNTFIKTADNLKLPEPVTQILEKPQVQQFIPRSFDVRPSEAGILKFEEVVRSPTKFAHFEEDLFSNGFIDLDYKFCNKQGRQLILSAIFRTLIRKNYFILRRHPGNRPIKLFEIRKFLDHRYLSSTDKEFRNWEKKQDKLDKLVSSIYWIDKIPVC